MKMLQPILTQLSSKRIVLASGSPRRRDILESIGLKFEITPSTFKEDLDKSQFTSPQEYVLETARRKTVEVAERLKVLKIPDLIIGADTVVTIDDQFLEKPSSKDDAFQMLSRLSGRSHFVHTGVVLVTYENSSQSVTKFHETTEVTFGNLTPEIIQGYIDTGEPLDKAGAYGIQALGEP